MDIKKHKNNTFTITLTESQLDLLHGALLDAHNELTNEIHTYRENGAKMNTPYNGGITTCDMALFCTDKARAYNYMFALIGNKLDSQIWTKENIQNCERDLQDNKFFKDVTK